jgi:hypothetical protein
MIATANRYGKRTLMPAVGFLVAMLRLTGIAAAAEQTTSTTGASSSGMAASKSMASMAHMGPGAMSRMSAMHSMSLGSVSIPVGSHSTNILPSWLAVLWMLVFLVIVAVHGRHVLESEGQRRVWHSGHVLMAIGMAVMFAPASVNHFNIPIGFWPLAFANAAIAIVLWMIAQAFAGRGTNVLWLLMAFDLAALAYMWSPSGLQAPIAWLLVAYFAVQAVLWATNQMRGLDERTILGGAVAVTPDGTLTASVAEPLIVYKDLRVSMAAMTIGMAYMFAAMQLLAS